MHPNKPCGAPHGIRPYPPILREHRMNHEVVNIISELLLLLSSELWFFWQRRESRWTEKAKCAIDGGVGLEPAPSGFWRLLLYLVSHAPHLHCPPLLSHPPPFASSTIYTSAFLCGVTANTNIKKNKKTKNRYFNNLLIFIDNHKISFIHPSFLFGTKLALPKALVTDQMTILPLKVQFCPGVVLVKGSGH